MRFATAMKASGLENVMESVWGSFISKVLGRREAKGSYTIHHEENQEK
jgi:hypothetical protein